MFGPFPNHTIQNYFDISNTIMLYGLYLKTLKEYQKLVPRAFHLKNRKKMWLPTILEGTLLNRIKYPFLNNSPGFVPQYLCSVIILAIETQNLIPESESLHVHPLTNRHPIWHNFLDHKTPRYSKQ